MSYANTAALVSSIILSTLKPPFSAHVRTACLCFSLKCKGTVITASWQSPASPWLSAISTEHKNITFSLQSNNFFCGNWHSTSTQCATVSGALKFPWLENVFFFQVFQQMWEPCCGDGDDIIPSKHVRRSIGSGSSWWQRLTQVHFLLRIFRISLQSPWFPHFRTDKFPWLFQYFSVFYLMTFPVFFSVLFNEFKKYKNLLKIHFN